MYPTVRLSLDTPAPRLDWYPIERYTKYAGELLAAFELLLVSVCRREGVWGVRRMCVCVRLLKAGYIPVSSLDVCS